MDLSGTAFAFGMLALVPIVAMYIYASRQTALGALSLPCLTMMTSGVYFFLMPVVALSAGDPGYFGIYIGDLFWLHIAVLLYTLGACAAFRWHWQAIKANPVRYRREDRNINEAIYYMLWSIALLSVAVQFFLGKLNLTGDANYNFDADSVGDLAFITQGYNLLIPLTLLLLIRQRFSWRSLAILAIILFIFLQIGFRFRIMILLAGVVSAFVLQRGIGIKTFTGIIGSAVALSLSTVLGAIRHYGQGIDLSGLNSERLDDVSQSFGGEFGVVYVLDHTTRTQLPPFVWFEPWSVALARFVPAFLWPDKPNASYLQYFFAGTTVANADKAGIAASQHVEMLLQFGWWGLLPLSFLYFSFACWLNRRVSMTGWETRVAGSALIPCFFGFYMQTRGYFFQIFVDGLFSLGPLFLLTLGGKPAATAIRGAPREKGYLPVRMGKGSTL